MPAALGYDVGRERSRAVYRLIAAILAFSIAAPVLALLFLVAGIAGLILLIADVILGIVKDETWSGGMAREWAERIFSWPFDIIWWIKSGETTTGDGEFPWTP